jgi:crotonobetainyl-CoA:carnitine CoA-transferase CaiB-like acyl-CoA transferase
MERTGLPSVLGPYNIVDIGTGVLATFAVLLGLYHRQASGAGQVVTASLVQAATFHQAPFMIDYPGHRPAEPRGYASLGEGPLQRYHRARDGWFFLAAREADRAALAEVAGVAGFADADLADLRPRLAAAGVAAHRAVPVAELMVDEEVRRRGLSVTQEVDGVGPCVMPGVSPRLSDTPVRVGAPPVRPGSDAAAVLAEIGLADRLPELRRGWAVRTDDLPAAWR